MTLSAQLRELAGKAASDNPGVSFDAKARLSRAMMVNRETIITALELQEVQRGPANGVNCSNCGCRLPADYISVCPDCRCGELQALKGGSQ